MPTLPKFLLLLALLGLAVFSFTAQEETATVGDLREAKDEIPDQPQQTKEDGSNNLRGVISPEQGQRRLPSMKDCKKNRSKPGCDKVLSGEVEPSSDSGSDSGSESESNDSTDTVIVKSSDSRSDSGSVDEDMYKPNEMLAMGRSRRGHSMNTDAASNKRIKKTEREIAKDKIKEEFSFSMLKQAAFNKQLNDEMSDLTKQLKKDTKAYKRVKKEDKARHGRTMKRMARYAHPDEPRDANGNTARMRESIDNFQKTALKKKQRHYGDQNQLKKKLKEKVQADVDKEFDELAGQELDRRAKETPEDARKREEKARKKEQKMKEKIEKAQKAGLLSKIPGFGRV